MLIKQITYYLQGKLSDYEALKLWERLLVDDKSFQLLEICLLIKKLLEYKNRASIN